MVCLGLALLSQVSESPEVSIAALTKNVGALPIGGIPGPVAVLGPNAFPIIQSRDGKQNLAMAAGAPFGRGRVIASTKINIGGADEESKKFTMNVLRWLRPDRVPKKIATLGLDQTASNLKALGFEAAAVKDNPRWTDYDIVLVDGHSLRSPEQVASLQSYVQGGGGLSVTGLAWGWAQITGKSIRDDALYNKLLVPMGLALSDGHIEKPLIPSDPANLPWDRLNAARIVLRLEGGTAAIPPTEAAQMSAVLTNALNVVPAGDSLLRRMRAISDKAGASAIPTKQNPVKVANVIGRASVLLRDAENRLAKPGELKADPAAATFPGLVPAGAKRESASITLNLPSGQWASTGLYLNAGEVATIQHPDIKNLRFQIGAHTDENWHHDNWERSPAIVYSWPATGTETKVASPFGGLIYVIAPAKSSASAAMTFSGVVRSPYYVHGRTTLAEWGQMVEAAPGPWAEFESDRLILTVPSVAARKVKDPQKLMELWERIMSLYVDLGTRPINHKERIVTDEQISAGYMHSGYPIMTWMDVQDLVVSEADLTTKGSWGHWHELGHNHQQSAWTFEGTGEVTCNLYTMYVYEHIVGKEAATERIKGSEAAFRKHIAAGAPYAKWKSEPFLALYMYWQLQQAFGWEAYKKVFAEYRDADRATLPKSDQEKRDQWMVRFSRAIGRNLGPFFEAWGVPTTAPARDSIKSLPVWMPDNFPVKPSS